MGKELGTMVGSLLGSTDREKIEDSVDCLGAVEGYERGTAVGLVEGSREGDGLGKVSSTPKRLV